MSDQTAPTTPRRIIRIFGGDLDASRQAGEAAEADIAREGDGVALTTIEAAYDPDYYTKFLDAMREAIRNGEQPIFYIDSHGSNNTTDGRHRIYLHAADATFEDETPHVTDAQAVSEPRVVPLPPAMEMVPPVPEAPNVPSDFSPSASNPIVTSPPQDGALHPISVPASSLASVPIGMTSALAPALSEVVTSEGAVEPRGNQDYSEDTDTLFSRMIADYQREYRAVHGANAVPPRVMFTLSSCFSEGALRDLPPSLLRQADFMVADSEQRYTYQDDVARILPALARGESAEVTFLRQLTAESSAGGVHAIPALATARGVVDGDALRDRVSSSNFTESMVRAQATISRLPEPIREEVSQTLGRLSASNIEADGNELSRALLGYMANYDERYSSYSGYRAQGQLLREYYRRDDRPLAENVAMLMRMDENHRDMVVGINGLRIPPGYLQQPNITNAEGQTALMAVADSSSTRGTQLLLALGANPNLADENGNTALFYAMRQGATDIAESLITAGGDKNHRNNDGDTLLHAAVSADYEYAALHLLDQGFDANAANNDGITPLMRAASMSDNPEILRTLITHGANVNQADKDGWTPIIYALSGSNSELVDTLIAAGADLTKQTNDGVAPLHVAAQGGHIAIVTRILDEGAGVNQASNDGLTPLMRAALSGNDNSEMIRLLLARGADINQRDATGDTALNKAAMGSQVNNIRALLDAGAEVNGRNSVGGTALLNAAFVGDVNTVQLLIDRGADVNAMDDLGATPLLAAIAEGNQPTVSLLQSLNASVGRADINNDGQLSNVEAQFFYLKKYLPDLMPGDTAIDGVFDTDRNGTATIDELALQLATHGVGYDEMFLPTNRQDIINRVAEELRAASTEAIRTESPPAMMAVNPTENSEVVAPVDTTESPPAAEAANPTEASVVVPINTTETPPATQPQASADSIAVTNHSAFTQEQLIELGHATSYALREPSNAALTRVLEDYLGQSDGIFTEQEGTAVLNRMGLLTPENQQKLVELANELRALGIVGGQQASEASGNVVGGNPASRNGYSNTDGFGMA